MSSHPVFTVPEPRTFTTGFKVSVVVPIYNEEGNVDVLADSLAEVLASFPDYEVIFVNDGSRDRTLQLLRQRHARDSKVHYLSFSRNFGHQSALRAGLSFASGDCIISMDGDMQHPPSMLPTLIEKWREGFDVVYTRRMPDPHLPFFKRTSSALFYKLINWISNVQIDPGAADFRLIDRQVLAVVNELREGNLFMRGIIAWVGFHQYAIDYMPSERRWGRSQYTFKKMLALATSGVTGFSIKPLHFSTVTGVLIAFASFCYAIYAIALKLFSDIPIAGWASVLVSVLFMGGVQLIMIGILGEYLGKQFMDSKLRPHYIVREKTLCRPLDGVSSRK